MPSISNQNSNLQNLRGWAIVFCGGLFYMYQFMVRVSPNIMNQELLCHFALDATGLGILLGAYNWSYSAMQIPLGITMDRFGPRIFLCLAALLCSLSCFIFGNTTSSYIGGFARFLMGMGSACGLIGTIKLGTIWLEPKHIAKVTSLAILMGTAGASLGGAPLETLLNKVGFKNTMEFLGFAGIIVSILIFIIVKNKPAIDHHDEVDDIYKNSHPLDDIMKLVKNLQAWCLAFYGMFMYLPITIIGVVWGVSFVRNISGMSDMISASIVSSMFFGAAIGSPCFAYISDYLKNRRMPMLVGSLVTMVIWTIILFVNLPLFMLYILFFIAGFAYTAKCLSFASICETMPLKMSGVSIAFLNAVVMSTGIIFLPLVGYLINMHWDGAIACNAPLYTVEDYRYGLIIIPVCLAISGIMTLFIKETHPERTETKNYGRVIDTDVL